MMCELKQALLDIEFLQECNNSVNLALSVTRKQLAAANKELADANKSRDDLYFMNQKLIDKLEQSEAQCQTLRELREYDAVKIDRMKRMDAALREIADYENTMTCDNDYEEGVVDGKLAMAEFAKAALEDKP